MHLVDEHLAVAVFGTTDSRAVRAIIAQAVQAAIGSEPLDAQVLWESVGVSVRCDLATGERLVLKAFQPRWTDEFLAAVRLAHRALHDAGVPVPEPVAGPAPLPGSSGRFVLDRWLDDPGIGRASFDDDGRRRDAARGLACITRELRARHHELIALRAHPLRAPADAPWNDPHSPAIDFSLDPEGAAWIDEVAWTARQEHDAVAATLPDVAVHADWALRNIRFDDRGDLAAVYDLDSLSMLPEAEAVGMAGCTWAGSGRSGERGLAEPHEVDAFVDDYASAVGRTFSTTERRLTRLAARCHVAYVARCEHAIEAAHPSGRDQARALLRRHLVD